MRAFFRVDASSTIGSGHLSRCLTLARSLVERGVTVEVATHAPSPQTLAWIAREGHRSIPINERANVAEARAAAKEAALVVVDGYAFDASYHAALRGPERIVCVIDDLSTAPIGGDVVLNGNLYACELEYEVAETLVGPKYALVRDEFVSARALRLERVPHGGTPRLLITMGGADPARETEKALAALSRLPALDVQIVVGGSNPRAERIRELCAEVKDHSLRVHVDMDRMGDLMEWCDVTLSASGSTCLELSCVGVAATVIEVADNQHLAASALSERGLMTVLGRSSSVGPDDIASGIAELLSDPSARHRAEAAQRAAIDGQGAHRAAARLVAAVERLR